jgi:hypothetical protein
MALNRQIWINTIVENFFPDDSFMAKSIDDSDFVNVKTVHIPNAGKPSSVVINRAEKPATIKERTDQELTYDIDELTTDPIHLSDVDSVELSYNKRNSILANDRKQLQKTAAQNLLYKWAGSLKNKIFTTGDAREAHTSGTATGNRKKFTKAAVMKAMIQFNKDDVPAENRFMLVDSVMYADLLDDLTDKELSAFLSCADASRGVLGKLYGFEIMQRSQVLRTTANGGALLKWGEEAVATELAAGLAWQQDCVSRALGEVKMFDDTGSPTYYGDIYSFLVRAGGSPRRYDGKGIAVIIESNAA